jgi:hypothetical protein
VRLLWVVWPFPVDISADQLLHGDSSRCHTRLFLRVTYEDRQVSRGPSSRRSPKCAPLPGSSLGVCSKIASPSGSSCVLSQLPRAQDCQIPNLVRPCRSSRLRRFTPHEAVRVCCTPLPTMRFTWFPADTRRCRRSPNLSHRCNALRSLSLSSGGFPVTRARPSRRWLDPHRSVCFAPTSGVCSTEKSVAHT